MDNCHGSILAGCGESVAHALTSFRRQSGIAAGLLRAAVDTVVNGRGLDSEAIALGVSKQDLFYSEVTRVDELLAVIHELQTQQLRAQHPTPADRSAIVREANTVFEARWSLLWLHV